MPRTKKGVDWCGLKVAVWGSALRFGSQGSCLNERVRTFMSRNPPLRRMQYCMCICIVGTTAAFSAVQEQYVDVQFGVTNVAHERAGC